MASQVDEHRDGSGWATQRGIRQNQVDGPDALSPAAAKPSTGPEMTASGHELIEANLLFILSEMVSQPEVAAYYPTTTLSYEEQMAQIREFIEMAGEYGLAYEYIVCALESFPFKISGAAGVKLLEVGLLMRFKSELHSDQRFDRRL
ncbi:hypothetical protein [Cupriavidus sp. TMH.W2]|uniref:hypothetical protein n=1 Tax=Cupriavidus sp. TMH.W2 TaxID=3434465 RepID=UPI003D775BC3